MFKWKFLSPCLDVTFKFVSLIESGKLYQIKSITQKDHDLILVKLSRVFCGGCGGGLSCALFAESTLKANPVNTTKNCILWGGGAGKRGVWPRENTAPCHTDLLDLITVTKGTQ